MMMIIIHHVCVYTVHTSVHHTSCVCRLCRCMCVYNIHHTSCVCKVHTSVHHTSCVCSVCRCMCVHNIHHTSCVCNVCRCMCVCNIHHTPCVCNVCTCMCVHNAHHTSCACNVRRRMCVRMYVSEPHTYTSSNTVRIYVYTHPPILYSAYICIYTSSYTSFSIYTSSNTVRIYVFEPLCIASNTYIRTPIHLRTSHAHDVWCALCTHIHLHTQCIGASPLRNTRCTSARCTPA